MQVGTIYCATFNDGSKYVGQTINSLELLIKRYQSYVNHPKAGGRRLCAKACWELGMPQLQVLEQCDPSELRTREHHWITELSASSNLLNIAHNRPSSPISAAIKVKTIGVPTTLQPSI